MKIDTRQVRELDCVAGKFAFLILEHKNLIGPLSKDSRFVALGQFNISLVTLSPKLVNGSIQM